MKYSGYACAQRPWPRQCELGGLMGLGGAVVCFITKFLLCVLKYGPCRCVGFTGFAVVGIALDDYAYFGLHVR